MEPPPEPIVADPQPEPVNLHQSTTTGAQTISEPVSSDNTNTAIPRQDDLIAIEGLPFSPLQADIAIRLFYDFAPDGAMTASGLAKALTYSWGLCFVSSELRADTQITAELKQAVHNQNSSLCRAIGDFDKSIFSRTFRSLSTIRSLLIHYLLFTHYSLTIGSASLT